MDYLERLHRGDFDFLDFGCSAGGSIEFAKRHLGGRAGLGLDNNPAKVALACENGFDAMPGNILDLPDQKLVEFVVLSHFLEHLEHRDVSAFLLKALAVASKFVLVQQPYFDTLPQLLEAGVKPCYSDWRGHLNSFSSFDFQRILESARAEALCTNFSIGTFRRVVDFSHWSLVPLDAPTDSKRYEPDYGPKPPGELPFPHFEELWIVATIDGNHLEHQELARQDRVLMSTFQSESAFGTSHSSPSSKQPEIQAPIVFKRVVSNVARVLRRAVRQCVNLSRWSYKAPDDR